MNSPPQLFDLTALAFKLKIRELEPNKAYRKRSSMDIRIASGSHVGTAHVSSGKNNQDAYVTKSFPGGFVGIICDGCSEGAHSEVGAWTAAELIAQGVATQAQRVFATGASNLQPSFWKRILGDALAQIRVQALAMAGSGSVTEVVMNYFLFTLVGVLVTPERTWLFSVGDGVFVVNGETLPLPTFDRNEPPYPSYALIGSKFDNNPDDLGIKVFEELETARIQSLILGSDGLLEFASKSGSPLPGRKELVGPLTQFTEVERFFKINVAVRQRLALVNTPVSCVRNGELSISPGLVQDDMTLIALRIVTDVPIHLSAGVVETKAEAGGGLLAWIRLPSREQVAA